MKFNEAVIKFNSDDTTPPKGLTEIEYKKLTHDGDSITTYSAATKLRYSSFRTKKKYPFELQYRKHVTFPLGKDDSDAFDAIFWDKIYKITLDDGFGVYARSTNGKSNFSDKGYKDWEIYAFSTNGGEMEPHNHYPNTTIKTEKKALDLIYKEVIPTIQTRQALGWDADKITQKSLK
jgi:hypothetical protein